MPSDYRGISQRILNRLLILIGVTVLLVSGAVIEHNWQVEKEALEQQATAWARELHLDLDDALDHEAQGLEQTLQIISAQSVLKQALAKEDTARLQADWIASFRQLRDEKNLTHFYFINRNQVCLLRLHLPQQHGDRIVSPTLLEAERTGKTAWGIELGKTGVLTLRVVQPVFESDRLVGYVELGKEIEPMLKSLHASDAHPYLFAIVLDKKHIDRANWETGMRMLGRNADWDALPRYVVEYNDPKLTLNALGSLLAQSDVEHDHIHTEVSGRIMHMQFYPLQVSGGEQVAALLVFHDIDANLAAINHRTTVLVLMTLFVAVVILAIFVWAVKRYSRQIEEQERLLHAENATNQALLRNASDGIHILDSQGHLFEASDSFCAMLGYRRDELIGQPATLWDAEVSKDELAIKLAQQLDVATRVQFETTHRRKDGSVIDVEVSSHPVMIGNTRYQFNSSRDITARKQTELALRESEQRFRKLFELSPDPVWTVDGHRFSECNQAAVEMLGFPDRAAFKNVHPAEISPEFQPDGESSFSKAERMMHLAEDMGLHRFEWVHRRRDGSDFHAEVTLSRMTLQGRPVIHAVVRNISDRKRVEDELRQSEEKLRTILDSVDAYIYLKDANGDYLFANAAVRNLWHAEMADIVGYADEKFFDAETAANIRRNDRQVLVDGITLRTEETNVVTATGLTFTYLSVKSPLRGPDGSIFALCGSSIDITDRKQMEESLRKSEQDLKEAQQIARVGNWELDIPHNRLKWSDEIFRIFEIDPAKFGASYDAFLDAIHPDDREAVNNAYADSLSTRQPYGIRHRLLMADGRIKHVREQCKTHFDETGNPIRSVGTVQDVTEQVQAEIALHDASKLLQAVINHVPMRVFWKDRTLRFLGCNPAFARDAGLSQPTELIGKDDYQMSWAREADLYRADDRKVIESGIPRINFEEPQTTPDGRTMWLRTSKVPLRNQNDEIMGVLGIYEDFTAEKEKDIELARHRGHLEQLVVERSAQLAEAQVKYQQLLDDMGDEFLVFSFTPDTKLNYVSNGFEAIFGMPREKALGQPFNEVVQWHPKDIEDAMQNVLGLISGKFDFIRSEMRFIHPDGRERTIYQTSHAARNASGDVGSVDGVLTDITERKRIEKEFLQAKLFAEAANRAKSAFLANMSHEIRTPMNGVIGMLEILSRSRLPAEEHKMLETTRYSARSLLGIIDDILDFSKIEAGKLSLVEQEVSLEGELDIVIGMIDRIAMDKQVDLTMFVEPNLPLRVMGDGLRLRQILTNLCGNAVKFSAGMERLGRVHLRAELEQCESGRVWVAFTIADNGIGMDAETVARLFQPFEQADSSTTRKFGGTGLGLSICHNLTSMMGGEITVQSEVEKGTTFTVRLPFTVASECPNPTSPYDLSGVACIVIADSGRYIDDFSRYLTHAGAQSHAFSDINAAWNFIGGHAPVTPICAIVMEDPSSHSAQEIVDGLLARRPDVNVHFVEVTYLSMERGRRRKVRRLAENIVQVDREALTRRRFLEAAAAAVGRVVIAQERDDEDLLDATVGAGLSILVAEDNEVNRDVIRRQLELLGHSVALAVDGLKAFQMWEAERYDLLLTDLHMPNKDGYELTALIRERERQLHRKRTPIIALTANAMKGEEARCLKQGMDAYLSKPIELASLKAVLDQWRQTTGGSAPEIVEETALPSHDAGLPDLPVFDPGVLTKMVGSNPTVHERLLAIFLESAQERKTALLAAQANHDHAAIGQIAHSLKSAARSVGAMQLGDLCEKLEQAGRAEDMHAALLLIPIFEEAHEAATAAINTRLGR